jgi:hypothetical protein
MLSDGFMVERKSDAPKGQPAVRPAIGSTRLQSCEASVRPARTYFLRVRVPDAPDSGKHVAKRARVSAVRRNLKEA